MFPPLHQGPKSRKAASARWVRVSHAAGDGACSFYDGHGHPFVPMWSGVARPSPIGVTGGPDCSWQAGPITLPLGRDGTGRAVVNVLPGGPNIMIDRWCAPDHTVG